MNTSLPTLFIQIASYRDPDLPATLHNLISRAAHPETIHFGICLQLAHEDPDVWGVAAMPRHSQLRLRRIPALQSQGACWARREAQRLYQGESFLLQIDSHTRALPGWDLKLLSMWRRCNDPKALLSVYPNGFEPPCHLDMATLPVMAAREFDRYGILRFQGISRYVMPRQKPSNPLPNAFVAGGFLFGPGSMIGDVPYDPELYFHGEEISMSARLWTHGYNIYTPNELVLFHLYKNKQKEGIGETHWKDHGQWGELNRRSLVRIHTLLESMTAAPSTLRANANDVKSLRNYGLGDERSLRDYQQWAGIDFKNQSISTDALVGRFPAGNSG